MQLKDTPRTGEADQLNLLKKGEILRISMNLPDARQSNEVWRDWFGSIQRINALLEDVANALEDTIGPQQ